MKNIAIIGAGISGIAAAYLLKNKYNVTIFESNSYFGGHSNTIMMSINNKNIPVDTGFIVFNQLTYPNLINFFKELGVKTYKSEMSFGITIGEGEIEYSGSSFNKFFAQRKNFFNRSFWRMALDILRFNKHASTINLFNIMDVTLEEYVTNLNLSEEFKNWYLYPMAGAIWSTPLEKVGSFPAHSFLQFFRNHGLLKIIDQPQWYTVWGGSKEYVSLALKSEKITKYKNCSVKSVKRLENNISISTQSEGDFVFDQIIFATPAYKTLEILDTPSSEEQDILKCFDYSDNIAYLHSDPSFMPERKNVWSSWNYFNSNQNGFGVTYWMNKLQSLPTKQNIFVTLNPLKIPSPSLTCQKIYYQHPQFDKKAINAQERISEIQGINNTWFCGSYQGYGFHEDGFLSALKVVNQLGVKASWQ